MIHIDNVFAYGFTQEEEKIIKKMLPAKESYLTSTDCFTDLIAVNSYAIFINASEVPYDEWDILWEYYLEVGVVAEALVIVGGVIIPEQLKKKVHWYRDFESLRKDIDRKSVV